MGRQQVPQRCTRGVRRRSISKQRARLLSQESLVTSVSWGGQVWTTKEQANKSCYEARHGRGSGWRVPWSGRCLHRWVLLPVQVPCLSPTYLSPLVTHPFDPFQLALVQGGRVQSNAIEVAVLPKSAESRGVTRRCTVCTTLIFTLVAYIDCMYVTKNGNVFFNVIVAKTAE